MPLEDLLSFDNYSGNELLVLFKFINIYYIYL
jgi:hypothetical protein